jgi:transposase
MPHKANDPRRHKFPKARYRIDNWAAYDAALRDRGDLTVWVTPEALAAWHPPTSGQRGRSPTYSDLAIETGMMLRLAFGRPWRQTEGLLRSVAQLMNLEIGIPDHTTLSRRSAAMPLAMDLARAKGPVQVVIDSTGLKVYGAGEWHRNKHGGRDRRSWRKLHLAMDPDTGEILACELTDQDQGDPSQVGALLDQVTGDIASVTADGAYDGEPVYRAVADRAPEAAVIIPPRSTAKPGSRADQAPTQRDRHIQTIAQQGRRGWQRATGYGRRSLAETAMFRYKTLIGGRLRARSLPGQKAEARTGCAVLNRMTQLGRPVSCRVV